MTPSPIADQVEICCPHCAKALLQVSSSGCNVVGQQFWLRDGDEIPGILNNLPSAVDALALSNMLSMGQCWSCFNYYYTVECTFMPGVEESVLIDWLAGAVADLAPPVYFTCDAGENTKPWLLSLINTDAGKVLEHTLGPFKLDRLGDVSGPHGVSACGPNSSNKPWLDARDLVLQQFETLQQFNHQAIAA